MTTPLTLVSNEPIEPSRKWLEEDRLEAKRVAKRLDESYFDAARVMYSILKDQRFGKFAWEQWGFGSFEEYAWVELGMNHRRVSRLVAIYEVIGVRLESVDPVIRGKLIALGFTKLLVLLKVLWPATVNQWLAEGLRTDITFRELEVKARDAAALKVLNAERTNIEAKAAKSMAQLEYDPEDDAPEPEKTAKKSPTAEPSESAEGGPAVPPDKLPDERLFRRTIMMDMHSWDITRQALQRAKQLGGSDKDGYNLGVICLQYLANAHYGKLDDYDNAREVFWSQMESFLKVKLVVADAETMDIQFGSAAIPAIAAGMRAGMARLRPLPDEAPDETVEDAPEDL